MAEQSGPSAGEIATMGSSKHADVQGSAGNLPSSDPSKLPPIHSKLGTSMEGNNLDNTLSLGSGVDGTFKSFNDGAFETDMGAAIDGLAPFKSTTAELTDFNGVNPGATDLEKAVSPSEALNVKDSGLDVAGISQ
ncbi:MAG: hypothetical protein ACJAW3_000028 [Lentimonas sp.]|jgi:hypothetical protein